MSIGERIKEARKIANVTQKELADRLSVSFTLISQYERGERNPKIDTLQRIATALAVPILDLIDQGTFTPQEEAAALTEQINEAVENGIGVKATFTIPLNNEQSEEYNRRKEEDQQAIINHAIRAQLVPRSVLRNASNLIEELEYKNVIKFNETINTFRNEHVSNKSGSIDISSYVVGASPLKSTDTGGVHE